MSSYEEIRSALSAVPASNRETWLRMGMAVKSELSEDGFSLWNEWSKSDETYNERDAESVWRSISTSGGVTIRSLFKEAARNGWKSDPSGDEGESCQSIKKGDTPQTAGNPTQPSDVDDERRRGAAARASEIWNASEAAPADHEYLIRKRVKPHGLRLYRGDLVIGGIACHGALIVPVRDSAGELRSLGFITAAGEKRYLPDGRISAGYHAIGKPNGTLVIAEGYATAASIYEATGHAVACGFNAGNLVPVAKALREKLPDIRIIIGADNDVGERSNVGVEKAHEAARAAQALVAVPVLNGAKTDFNDLSAANGAEAVRLAIEAAKPPQKPQAPQGMDSRPVPLIRELAKPDDYPIDALGPILGPAARAIIEAVQVPPALAGNSVLAAAALCAQPHANVETLGGMRPLALYMLTVAVSGERKTSADHHALEPVREYAKRLRLQYQTALKDFDAESEAQKVRVKKAKEEAQDADGVASALKDIPAVVPPRKPYVICTEPTAEGLIVSLQDGQLSQGVFSDEAGSFIGGHALKEEAELRSIAILSRAWDGSPLDRVRAKDRENTTLYGRRVSLHLMAQPDVAALMLGKSLYRSQGFLARFLIAQPESLIGTRMHDGQRRDVAALPAMRAYWTALTALLEREPQEHPELGGLEPGNLRLTPEARAQLIAAYNEIETAQGEDQPLAGIKDFASKAAEHACRIAGTLALVTDPSAMFVSLEDMQRALTLMEFYIGEQHRLSGAASITIETRNAVRLWEWIARKGLRRVTPTDVMKSGPNCIRESAGAKAALRLLAENAWLQPDGRSYVVTLGALAELAGGT